VLQKKKFLWVLEVLKGAAASGETEMLVEATSHSFTKQGATV
jgi:hypothetical protein